MSYNQLAKQVVEGVGGVGNISNVTHCMTRLRFHLKDDSLANKERLMKIEGVAGVTNKGGQYQIIIGTHVAHVFDEVAKIANVSSENQGEVQEKKKGFISNIFDTITGIFAPIVPAIAGSGMIKAVLTLLTIFGLLSKESQTYYILNFVADAAFYFLPVLLAFSSAHKFKANPYLATVMGGVLLHPSLGALVTAGEPVSFIGLPITLVSYSSSVVPIILIVLVQSYVERFAKKISPNAIRVFFYPLVTILVMTPIALAAVGPIGTIVGDGLAGGFAFLNDRASWFAPFMLGALCPLLVMTGMHYSLMPVALAQYATMGYGTILGPGMLASNIAQGAAAIVVGFKTKDKALRRLALSSGVTALMGITEPAMYGVNAKLKRPLIAVLIGGGVSGLYAGIMNIKTYASATAGIPALPIYVGGDSLWNLIHAIITIVISFVVTAIVTIILGFKETEKELEAKLEEENKKPIVSPAGKKIEVSSPLIGSVVPLGEVKDEAFSTGAIGEGVGISPSEGKVYSPFSGTVEVLFPTKHAIGLKSDDGVEVLIHIGIDTVNLGGKYFESHIQTGQTVQQGDLLVEFDIEGIKKEGFDTMTPVIITNSSQYLDIIETETTDIGVNERLLTLVPVKG